MKHKCMMGLFYCAALKFLSNTGVSPDSELSDPMRTLVPWPVSEPGKKTICYQGHS